MKLFDFHNTCRRKIMLKRCRDIPEYHIFYKTHGTEAIEQDEDSP